MAHRRLVCWRGVTQRKSTIYGGRKTANHTKNDWFVGLKGPLFNAKINVNDAFYFIL